jgi:hypothetical protein
MLTDTENNLLVRVLVSSTETFDPKKLGSQEQKYYARAETEILCPAMQATAAYIVEY